MAYKVIVTRSAQRDLDNILGYLVQELANPTAAMTLLDEVEQAYERLMEGPRIYALCAHPLLSAPGYRKIVIRGYLLIFRVDEEKQAVYVERFFSDLEDYANKI